MKIKSSITAFSLLELIIATVLVSVVLMGIFAINNVLNNNSQDYGQRYLIKSATQTTLNHILNNASEAIGSGTNINGYPDLGILIGGPCSPGTGGNLGCSDPNNAYTFCIHQDIPPGATSAPYYPSPPFPAGTTIDNAAPNSPATTPPYYNNSYPATTYDSRWLCYTWSPVTYQINYCSMPYYSLSTPSQGAVSCTGVANSEYLGTAASNPVTSAAFNSTSGFSITINNCLNNSASTCSGGNSTDQANNPSVQLSGSIFPSQEGMQ